MPKILQHIRDPLRADFDESPTGFREHLWNTVHHEIVESSDDRQLELRKGVIDEKVVDREAVDTRVQTNRHIEIFRRFIEGKEITQLKESEKADLRRGKIGFVFQQFNLIASLTVAETLAFQARLADRLDPSWLAELTRRLGLSQITSRYPEQLSGGQQQRVAVGRALAVKPRLLLADEPTGNLDEKTGDSVLALTLELVEETGCAFLMATHSARLAARLQRQCRLESGVLTCP